MFIFRKKPLFFASLVLLVAFILVSNLPIIKIPLQQVMVLPCRIVSMLTREVSGLIFYHRNFMENRRLKKDIDALEAALARTQEIRLENQRLADLLNFKQKSAVKLIAAKVVARAPDNWTSLILIDKNRLHGIRPAMVVVTSLGLVGRVVDASPPWSKVMLMNDPGFGVSAMAQRSRDIGVVTGTLGSTLLMKYLPKEADIKVSDVIVSSGLTQMYPKGLLIGKVVEVGEEFSGLTKYALIRSAVDLFSLEEVLVMIQ